jgi:hypothetical protein
MQITIRTEAGDDDTFFKVVVKAEGPRGFSGEWGTLGIWERQYRRDLWSNLDAMFDVLEFVRVPEPN